MKIQKTELATKLNQIKGVVPKKTTMPILQGILVKEGYLIANNLEMTVKAKLEGTEGSSIRKSILACVGRGSTPQERVRAKVQTTGNKWAVENFNATHN